MAAGKLPFTVDELGTFLIEVPADSVNAVTVTGGPNGDIFPNGTVYVPKGEDKTFVFTPHTGYVLDTVTVDGNPVSVTGNSYTLTDVQTDHTLRATFKKPSPPPGGGGSGSLTTYTVTIPDAANGSTSPTGKVTVKHGDSLTTYFYPDEGYVLDRVLVDGAKVSTGSNSYTLTVTKSVTVAVSFKEKTVAPPSATRTITATSGGHGKVSPGGTTTVRDGGDLYVYFIPDKGYEVDKVTIDGTAVDAGTNWHFINIRSDHVIHVTFRLRSVTPSGGTAEPGAASEPAHNTVTIRVEGGNGTVSPSGQILVETGGSQTVYFYPDEGYEVDKVLINGEEHDGSGGSYTLENVQVDTEVSVSFKSVGGTPVRAGCHCLWQRLFGRCFICGWFDRCITPWCWIIPLLAVIAAGVTAWLALRRKKALNRRAG